MMKTVCAIVALTFLFTAAAHAMGSTNYTINWDSVNSGGDDISSSTNFRMHDTIGEQATGSSTSASFSLRAGYRFGDTDATILTFDVGTQENSTETSYTAFDNAGKTVTVSSAASFSVGNFIGVVENKGLSELIAVGKITDVSGLVITVDKWDGVPSSLSATPAGADDFVYRLSGDAAQLGTLSTTAGMTSLTHTSVVTNDENGYTVYLSADGNLRVDVSTFINNVSDGSVTVGSEEYGTQTFGTLAANTGSDFPPSTSATSVQSSLTFADDDRVAVEYKAAIDATTPSGSYSQIVTYAVTANF